MRVPLPYRRSLLETTRLATRSTYGVVLSTLSISALGFAAFAFATAGSQPLSGFNLLVDFYVGATPGAIYLVTFLPPLLKFPRMHSIALVASGVGFLACLYTFLYATIRHKDLVVEGDFAATMSQVIPTIVIALVIEGRRWQGYGGLPHVLLTTMAVVGEGIAVTNTAFGGTDPLSFALISGAMVSLGLALVGSVASHSRDGRTLEDGQPD